MSSGWQYLSKNPLLKHQMSEEIVTWLEIGKLFGSKKLFCLFVFVYMKYESWLPPRDKLLIQDYEIIFVSNHINICFCVIRNPKIAVTLYSKKMF